MDVNLVSSVYVIALETLHMQAKQCVDLCKGGVIILFSIVNVFC